MSDGKATVFIVDDDGAVVLAISGLVESVGLNARTFLSAKELLETDDLDAPGCLVLDIRMPNMSGLELFAKLREMDIQMPVIFLTAYGDVAMAVEAMKDGAIDFIEKPFRNQALLDTIHLAVTADAKARVRHTEKKRVHATLGKLTPRERQIMDLLLLGTTNKNVAADLGISTKTVDYHRSRIMAKTQVASLVQLTREVLLAGEL